MVVVALATAGDRPLTVLTFLAVWLVSTTVPGVLVWRALARPTSIVQELGFGSVLGIGLLLLAWLPATVVGQPELIWVGPIGVWAVFAAVPGLRRHFRPRRPGQHATPRRWHLAMMVVTVLAFLRFWAKSLRTEALPPHASTIFQDVWYELALTQHLRHSVAITDPAVAGVPLKYHWFSNAHAAAMQALSGAPPAEVVMHLWLVPMLVTYVFALAAAGERILQGAWRPDGEETARRWWVGPLAALLAAALPVTLFLGSPRLPEIDNGFAASSTSGVLGLTIILALVGPVLDLLHGRGSRGTWVLLGLLLVLSTGSKPSILPVVACGSALALMVQWVQTRRFPKVPAALGLASVVLIPLASLALTGSTGGSRLQLFGTLRIDPAFGRAVGTALEQPGHGGLLVPGLAGGSVHVWLVAGELFAVFVLTELPRLIGILGVGNRALRDDPGLWWCTGVVAAGFSGLWVLAHPAYSQHYFWRIVIGLGVVLTVTTAVRLLPPSAGWPEVRRDVLLFSVAGLVTGVVLLPAELVHVDAVGGRLLPYGAAGLVLVVLLVVSRPGSGRFRLSARRLPALVLVSCFCVSTALPIAVIENAGSVAPALAGAPAPTGPSARYLTSDEQVAALWLADHSNTQDVVATNVFCAPTSYSPGCRHVAFWVAALTGRQLWIGAWAYTEKSLTAYADQNEYYQRTPTPYPGRVDLSLRAVSSPTPAVVEELRSNGVDWIFADRRATAISPDLDRYAKLRYANADVRIYQLPG